MTKRPKDVVRPMNLLIPTHIKLRLRIEAAKNDTTMTDMVVAAIEAMFEEIDEVESCPLPQKHSSW